MFRETPMNQSLVYNGEIKSYLNNAYLVVLLRLNLKFDLRTILYSVCSAEACNTFIFDS